MVLGQPDPVQVAVVGEVGEVGGDGQAGVEQFPQAMVDPAEDGVHAQVDGGVDDALVDLAPGQAGR